MSSHTKILVSKKEKEKAQEIRILQKIQKNIPNDLHQYIFTFIPEKAMICVNKQYYKKNREIICLMLRNHFCFDYGFQNYARLLIRKDYGFLFQQLLQEQFHSWWHCKRRCIYKNKKYVNFITFLVFFCIECSATRCRNILNDYLLQY